MAKPRTNADAASYWADGILALEPQPTLDVNSVQVRGDIVYSFGRHFPMGMIQRNAKGQCVRVLINKDHYTGANGFANTGSDQSNVYSEALARVSRSRRKIELQRVYLSSYALDREGGVRVRPYEGDPEPPWPSMEIPLYFTATDPGPEPVKDPRGCWNGHRHTVGAMTRELVNPDQLRPNDSPAFYDSERDAIDSAPTRARSVLEHIKAIEPRFSYITVMRWTVTVTDYIDTSNTYWAQRESGVKTEQCPHCNAFDRVHHAWHVRMFGTGYGRGREQGWSQYQKFIEQFGDERGWREARREDYRRVRRGRETHAEWVERNHIPLDYVSATNGIPNYDSEGYPLRKDEHAYRRAQRATKRRERALVRAHAAREREQRQLERFRRGMRRRRRPNFFEVAAETTNTLVEIREAIDTRNNPQLKSEETT